MKILNPAFVGFFKFCLEMLIGFGTFSVLVKVFSALQLSGTLLIHFKFAEVVRPALSTDGVFLFVCIFFSISNFYFIIQGDTLKKIA